MLYLFETNLSIQKPVSFALAKIHGIGKNTAFSICKKLGFSSNLKIKDLTQEQVIEIISLVEFLDLSLNSELKKLRSLTLKNSIAIKAYKGLRRVRGLPVRGQRTRTNAKSAKRNKRLYD